MRALIYPILLCQLVGIGFFPSLYGQGLDSFEVKAELELRYMDAEKLASYRADPEFDYTEEAPKISMWGRFLKWLQSKLGQNGEQSQTLGKILGYGLAILFIGLLVLQLLKVPIQGLWLRKASSLNSLDILGEDTDIQEWDFEEKIAASEAAGDYRRALRLLFLESLKVLSAGERITWNPHKTNLDYEKELKGGPYQNSFHRLRRVYEFVWYGDFTLSEQQYQETRDIFSGFKELLAKEQAT